MSNTDNTDKNTNECIYPLPQYPSGDTILGKTADEIVSLLYIVLDDVAVKLPESCLHDRFDAKMVIQWWHLYIKHYPEKAKSEGFPEGELNTYAIGRILANNAKQLVIIPCGKRNNVGMYKFGSIS